MLFLREQDRHRDKSASCSGRGTGARVTSAPPRRDQQRRAPRADCGALLSCGRIVTVERRRDRISRPALEFVPLAQPVLIVQFPKAERY